MPRLWLCRECSSPFHLARYVGKYEPPPTTPDILRVQKVMAGMADRGAKACVYEVDFQSTERGWCVLLPLPPQPLSLLLVTHLARDVRSCFNALTIKEKFINATL
jgi:hypothetical protein